MVLFVRHEKMSEITRCPKCFTRFKVTVAQLDAHDGLVRCGHCHHVFDALKHLHDEEPSPQLSLPIDPEPQLGEFDLKPIPNIPELEAAPTTLAQQVRFVEELTEEAPPLPPRKISWTGVSLALLLSLTLLAQAVYHFRVEVGTRLPGLKPLLEQYCALLNCTVTLPQNIDLIVIESSELQSEPEHASIVTLQVLLHNRAPYTQAYPSLELTLTDFQDKPVVRRVFRPADYLKGIDTVKQGIAPNRDQDIKLYLDTFDLRASGYRLALFYPQ
jgi:predicted Zn finger-like uncharacterized protein